MKQMPKREMEVLTPQMYYVLLVLSIDGESCVMDGFPLVSVFTWRYAMGTLAVKKIRREPVTDPRLILS